MPSIMVREVDATVLRRLRAQARRHGRSLAAEVRLILREATRDDGASATRDVARVQALFAGRVFPDSSDLVRQDRER